MIERLLGGAAALVLVGLAAGTASAQNLSPFGMPLASPSPEKPVGSRDAENFDPFGARVGSFNLFPKLEVTGYYDSNIFAAQNNQVDDFVTMIQPSLLLQSDWNLHFLSFGAWGNVARYADNTAENYADYRFDVAGKLDLPALGRDSNLFARASHLKSGEDRGSPNAVNGSEPTNYTRQSAQLGGQYKPGRLGLLLAGSFDKYDYDDVPTSTGAVINNDDRDRRDLTQSLRVGYEIVPGYEGFARGTLRQVKYDTTPDDSGRDRDSTGYDAVGGLKIDFGRITDVELYAGYLSYDYDDARLQTINGVSFGGAVNWNGIRALKVRAGVDRNVQETTDVNFSGYLATAFSLSADYDFRPNIKFNSRISYTLNDYQKASTFAGSAREDAIIEGEVGMKYLFTRNYYVNPSYRYNARDSNVNGSDYDRNRIYVKLGVQY